jgi:hypothetical protein
MVASSATGDDVVKETGVFLTLRALLDRRYLLKSSGKIQAKTPQQEVKTTPSVGALG